ncbi:hypothetical protein [Aequorivita sp. CIP111184]|uniref:hypothetical protein n=1 Tax=Aequorivita sp. CIP111184 TaxID=2211356 RepID=UPI000DBC3786|nr:hypothetical protein [Aequorivita sp. CIP111184]SRX56046.1 hypothetical protein AEQU1_03072 [Aequorivita sp. CIP111184]
MASKKIKFTFSLFAIICFGAFSQNNPQNNIYETYDKIVGLDNTGLYNGTEFADPFLNTDGSYRYFNGFDYFKGSVEYNGQYYVNVFLKYDLLADNLLVRSDDNLSIFNVNLIPEFVKEFSIYNKHFVRLTKTNLNFSKNGFFEKAYLGNDLSIYIKHTKKKKEKPLKSGIQYSFTEVNFYVLQNDETYYLIDSSKDIEKILPEKKEQIRSFHKSYKTLYKSNPDSYMTKLVKYLDGSIDNIKQP